MNPAEILSDSIFRPPTCQEAVILFRAAQDTGFRKILFTASREVRRREQGDRFYFSGGISGVLQCNLKPLCLYCPYWRCDWKAPLSIDEIVSAAHWFNDNGIREFHLSGGSSADSNGNDILEIVKAIWDSGIRDMRIAVNCGGGISLNVLKKLKAFGVLRIGVSFETMNPKVFKTLKPGDNLDRKIEFANLIGKAGLELGAGLMAGLGPSESRFEDYAYSLDKLRHFPHLSYINISKFRPYSTIPMSTHPICSINEAAVLVAVARLMLRGIHIRAAGGWLPDEQEAALNAGAGGDLFTYSVCRQNGYWGSGRTGSVQFISSLEHKIKLMKKCQITFKE